MNNRKIQKAWAVYTGGNIWLFYGKLQDGTYFLTDDYGSTQILDSDPSDFDVTLYQEWQDEHRLELLESEKRLSFCDSLCDYLQTASKEERGGISSEELDGYREYFKELW